MRKFYIAPEAEIDVFDVVTVITASGGIGDGGNVGGDIDAIIEDPDEVVIDTDTNEIKLYIDGDGNEYTPDEIDSEF